MDGKASLLLAFDGVALAGLWTAGRDAGLSSASLGLAVVSGLLFLASIVVALLTVRPRMGDGRSGFPLWARLSASEADAVLTVEAEAVHVVALSKITVLKMGAFRRAIDLTLAGLGAAVLAAAVQVAAHLL
ncbi:Pycsar system effector family protein [Streptomyces sp. NPDC102406]|uniref:Pycsar system effector family protein n=1 Tax=Streptomyces sp. NPDC102406 TaxID=3366171 RepID=UPI00380200DC